MSKDENPCRYCVPPKRKPYCHAECKEAKEWNEKEKEKLERIKKNIKKERELDAYFIRLTNRIKKGRHRKT